MIPKNVREALKVKPGTAFNVVAHNGHIELLPVRSAKEMRGFLRGIAKAEATLAETDTKLKELRKFKTRWRPA